MKERNHLYSGKFSENEKKSHSQKTYLSSNDSNEWNEDLSGLNLKDDTRQHQTDSF